MQIKKEFHSLLSPAESLSFEWLETNGLGGWSSSTVNGCNIRRYHGLLVAATQPPVERMVLLSKLDETIINNEGRFELSTNDYGTVIHPKGYTFLTSFQKVLFPEFEYKAGGVTLRKTILMYHGKNAVVIRYRVLSAASPFLLQLLPLLAMRDYHSLFSRREHVSDYYDFSDGLLTLKPFHDAPKLFIKLADCRFVPGPDWYYHFHYQVEKERGLDHVEDLFTAGYLEVNLQEGDEIGIVVSTEDPRESDWKVMMQKEESRRKKIAAGKANHPFFRQLKLAGDQFLVERNKKLKTMIAGYHWFTDWGRDTMIALPGICLSTGRLADAKKILSAFAAALSEGMIPNRFQDGNRPAEYNNVDGTLWFFVAVYRYFIAGGDKRFLLNKMLPVLREIIHWYEKGTRYNIHEDADGLIDAAAEGQQLTWMDAKVDDWVVTPRRGKPVEVNALWYNARLIYANLLELNGSKKEAALEMLKAKRTWKSFNLQFWNEAGGFLFDVIDGADKDHRLRPNQLFAISLPFPLINRQRSLRVLRNVTTDLYTPFGLRSLSPSDAGYIGICEGSQLQRDAAYHQGTVWSWLIGPYIDALVKVKGERGRFQALDIIRGFQSHLQEAGVGSVSEIFDGDSPHHPRGCIAQAWSVGELLRMMKEYSLYC